MGLFATTKKPEKNKTALFYVDVEDITQDEFERLKQWVKENIPSTERYTPEWKEDDDTSFMMGITGVTPNVGAPSGGGMQKLRFRFKHEEHAMAFKLIL